MHMSKTNPAPKNRKLKSTSGATENNPNFPATEAEAHNIANKTPIRNEGKDLGTVRL
jgi:hypothetical protein